MSNEPQLGESLGACPALSEYLRISQEGGEGRLAPAWHLPANLGEFFGDEDTTRTEDGKPRVPI